MAYLLALHLHYYTSIILGTNCRLFGADDASRTLEEPNRWVKACVVGHWIKGREWTYKGIHLRNTRLLVTVPVCDCTRLWPVDYMCGECIKYGRLQALFMLMNLNTRTNLNATSFCTLMRPRKEISCGKSAGVAQQFFSCRSLIRLKYVKKCHHCVFVSCWLSISFKSNKLDYLFPDTQVFQGVWETNVLFFFFYEPARICVNFEDIIALTYNTGCSCFLANAEICRHNNNVPLF